MHKRAVCCIAALSLGLAGCSASGNTRDDTATGTVQSSPAASTSTHATTPPPTQGTWELATTPCPPSSVNHVRVPTPAVAMVAVDACNLLVAAGPAVWIINRGSARPVWTIPPGYDTAAIAYAGGKLWWAGRDPDGARLLSVDAAHGTMSDVTLGSATSDIVALRVMGDRVLAGMTVGDTRSVVAAVKGNRLEPLLERPGRISGLAADPTSIAAVFTTTRHSTVVWGRPDSPDDRTWNGSANTVDVAISGGNIAVGLTRLTDEQVPNGSEILRSSDRGHQWSVLDLGNDELASLAFESAQLWLSKSGPDTKVTVYTATPSGSLKPLAVAGTSEQPLRLLPVPGWTWVVGSETNVLAAR